MLKIVVLPKNIESENHSQRQAKLLLYNEYSVLSLLHDQDGVVHHKGLYMDRISNQASNDSSNKNNSCWNPSESVDPVDKQSLDKCQHNSEFFERRLILAFECYCPHMFNSPPSRFSNKFNKYPKLNSDYENLQEYVKRMKNIPELKALDIFSRIVKVIYDLHKKNIAHRDLRLENILYNHRNGQILLISFGLARYVINDSTFINDHRGSSAYISPDVLKRQPYNPKASDCWALGVIFYTMLFGKFPFYADSFGELFKKINSGIYCLPTETYIWKNASDLLKYNFDNKFKKENSIIISSYSIKIIEALIVTDPQKRIKISELKKELKCLINFCVKITEEVDNHISFKRNGTLAILQTDIQVVPEVDYDAEKLLSRKVKNYLLENSDTANSEGLLEQISSNVTERHQLSQSLSTSALHDHNYSQFTDHPHITRHRYKSSIDNIISKAEKIVSSPSIKPSPYFSLENKFYLKFDESPLSYLTTSNTTPLFLENRLIDADTKSKIVSSKSNSIEMEKRKCLQNRHSNKKFKSDFSVIKMDSDFRALDIHELNLYDNMLSFF